VDLIVIYLMPSNFGTSGSTPMRTDRRLQRGGLPVSLSLVTVALRFC